MNLSCVAADRNCSNSTETTSHLSCVEEVGATYSSKLVPCAVVLYDISDREVGTKGDVPPHVDGESLDGLTPCANTNRTVHNRRYALDVADWIDPCVGLRPRCYHVDALSASGTSKLESLLQGTDSEANSSTFVSIDCTADYEQTQELIEEIEQSFQDGINTAARVMAPTLIALSILCLMVCFGLCVLLWFSFFPRRKGGKYSSGADYYEPIPTVSPETLKPGSRQGDPTNTSLACGTDLSSSQNSYPSTVGNTGASDVGSLLSYQTE